MAKGARIIFIFRYWVQYMGCGPYIMRGVIGEQRKSTSIAVLFYLLINMRYTEFFTIFTSRENPLSIKTASFISFRIRKNRLLHSSISIQFTEINACVDDIDCQISVDAS
jgi:hypothetical protein